MRNTLLLPASLLAFITPALAQLPYNPTRILSAVNGTVAYIFSPQPSSSQFSLSRLDTADHINATSPSKPLFHALPFLSSSAPKSFLPLADEHGITVLAGDCQASAKGVELWRMTVDKTSTNETWTALQVNLDDSTLSADYLSAGLIFSPTASTSDASIYVFGGMCPNDNSSDADDWVSDATYSNTMLTLSVSSASRNNAPYQLSITGSRAPPIAEAGLTMTPLAPSFTNTSSSTSQQQNFVLLGGHTQNAFINMSQVAMFSLPQESWAFIGVDQPTAQGNTELLARDTTVVEPRSGHTAVLTEDGSKIIVLGGWVGDISTPALPQLAVLEIGQGYGGSATWSWAVPPQTSNPFGASHGVYGHGAAMLPGGVMIVYGGYPIATAGSKVKRQTSEFLFFNTTSMSWMDNYINPHSPSSPAYIASGSGASSGLKQSEKAGLGAGLGLGIAVAAAITIFWLLYSRRLRKRRAVREKELRELALGAERYHTPSLRNDDSGRYPAMRTASWGNVQEKQIESSGDRSNPWAPLTDHDVSDRMHMDRDDYDGNGLRQAERTGVAMEVPSPTRGLRRSLHSRGPQGFGALFQPLPGGAPGSVFRIDEEEEGSQVGSFKRSQTPKAAVDRRSVHSDPFKDPPVLDPKQDEAAEQRKKEVQGWVEDWASAAESMNLSRNPSQAHSRTYSNLSQAYSHSHSNTGGNSDHSGRGSSSDKSDRTGSNLSDRSIYSQASMPISAVGTLSRNISQRSASAGYALFSGAAAAMSRLAGTGARPDAHTDYSTTNIMGRAPSNRSVSLNVNTTGAHAHRTRDRVETISISRPSMSGGLLPTEDQSLLVGINSNPTSRILGVPDDYWTPPESPVKERDAKYYRASSLTKTGVKALGILGSVKRVFTGTGSVDVSDRVADFENRSGQSSPTKHSGLPEMAETTPRRTASASQAFWHGKMGAKDWGGGGGGGQSDSPMGGVSGGASVRRKPVPGSEGPHQIHDATGNGDDDWDIETAIQQRVVQVMFTVPKEKLRVVNADALSLLSSNRSEVDHDEEKDREKEVKRMSGVREGDEGLLEAMEEKEKQKGKGKEVSGRR